jgi:hypothetical protein
MEDVHAARIAGTNGVLVPGFRRRRSAGVLFSHFPAKFR